MATAASGAGDGFEEFCREEFNPAEVFSKPEALKGYRVLSCTQYILGPSCASYLGELGAEVIKIEQPRAGEPMRHTTPWNEPSLYPLSRWLPERGRGLGPGPGPRLLRHPRPGPGRRLRDHRSPGGVRRVPVEAHHLARRLLGRDDAGGPHPRRAALAGHPVRRGGVPRVLPGGWGHPSARVVTAGVRAVRRRSAAVGQLGHRVGRARDHPLRQVFLLVTAYEDADFARLCRATGLQDLAAKYPDLDARVPPDAQREIYAALEAWAADKTKEDAARVLDDNDVLNQPARRRRFGRPATGWSPAPASGWTTKPSATCWPRAPPT